MAMTTRKWTKQEGVAVAMFAIMLPVFLGALGLAIDAGATYEQNRRMQTAADSAALAAAQEVKRENAEETENAALAGAYANGFAPSADTAIDIRRPPTTGAYKGDSEYVEVIISHPQPLYFMRLFKEEAEDIRARSVAGTQPSDTCLLVKNPSASKALDVGGNATVRFEDCGITVNSDHSTAASATGSSSVEASHITVAGGTTGSNFSPDPYTGAEPLDDPLASFVMPAMGACTFTGTQIIMTSTTLSPGVYCGGIELRSQSQVTFNPGVYYLAGGGLNANAGASLTGTGVTFVNTEKKPGYNYDKIWINGGALIDLSAPTSGVWQGILFYQDPKIKSTKVNIFNGGASMKLTGIVYFPTTSTKFSGDFGTDSQQLLMIGDKVEFTGNTNFKGLPKDFLPRTLLAARVVE
jgi:hypothetical protein